MRYFRGAIAGLALNAAALGVWQAAAADPPAPAKAGRDVSGGVSDCKACHSHDPQLNSINPLRDYINGHQSRDYIRLDESLTWERTDPHSRAFTKMTHSDRGKRMAAKYNANTDARCLACHAVDLRPDPKSNPVPAYAAADSIGVGCNACHGVERKWQTEHYSTGATGKSIEWRTKSPGDKQAAGMTDLRNPAVKAALCVSCHVGSVNEGKVLTHEMYVAGHPPLPPFELSAFTDGQPQHWRNPFDRPLNDYLESLSGTETSARAVFSYRKAEGRDGYTARHIAVGAIAALKSEAGLLVAAAQKPVDGGLDFARFDCYACHHDLKKDSGRQKRGFEGAPGRPPLKQWNGALARAVAAHAETIPVPDVAARAKEFPTLWKAAQDAAHAKPFADTKAMITAANALSLWCAEFMKTIQANDAYPRGEAAKLLAVLEAAAASERYDAEAVAVLVWAYRSLDAAIRETPRDWSGLDIVLPTRVRTPAPKPPGHAPIEDRMKRFNAFDAEKFRKAFPPER